MDEDGDHNLFFAIGMEELIGETGRNLNALQLGFLFPDTRRVQRKESGLLDWDGTRKLAANQEDSRNIWRRLLDLGDDTSFPELQMGMKFILH